MRVRQAVAAVLIVSVAATFLAGPVLGSVGPAPAEFQTDEPDSTGANGSEGAFGEQIASFAQASAVDAQATTDRGMWQAEASRSEDPAGEVAERSRQLERQLDRLENRSQRLQEQRESGTISQTAYEARASAIRSRLANLRESIEDTAALARDRGVNTSSLDQLRSEAANVTPPAVSERTRQITEPRRGPPDGAGDGPPEEAGPPDEEDDGTGPPEDARQPSNESEAGSPGNESEGGDPSGNGSEAGPPDDAGGDGGGEGSGDGGAGEGSGDGGDGSAGEGSGDGGDGSDGSDGGAGDGGEGGDGSAGDGGGGSSDPPEDNSG